MALPVFEAIDSLFEKYKGFLVQLCEIESNSYDAEGVNRVGEKVIELAKSLGLSVTVFPMPVAGDVVQVSLNEDSKLEPIFLSAHMDTVFQKGDFGPSPVHIDGNYIYGPGVADCKGGIAIAMLALEALKKTGFTARPVKLILQSEEEIGSKQSGKKTIQTIIDQAQGCYAFLNGECHSKDRIVIRRGGIFSAILAFHGVSCHSQNPFAGASAIREAAYKVLELEAHSVQGGITYNCGTIQGGTSSNTVPGECEIRLDVRYQKLSQLEEIEAFVRSVVEKVYVPNVKTELVSTRFRPPMEPNEKIQAIFDKLRELGHRYGLGEYEPGFSAGGSDAANVSAAGIPCVDSMGIAGEKIHTTEERADLDSMLTTAKLIAAFVLDSCRLLPENE